MEETGHRKAKTIFLWLNNSMIQFYPQFESVYPKYYIVIMIAGARENTKPQWWV